MKDGKYFSQSLQQNVWVSKIIRDSKFPYCECEKCGKLLYTGFYSVTLEQEGTEALYGSECVKKLNLVQGSNL